MHAQKTKEECVKCRKQRLHSMTWFRHNHFTSTTRQLFSPSQARVELTIAASNTSAANKNTLGWWWNLTFPLAHCVIWHSREAKNKRNKTNRGIPGLSAGNTVIWFSIVMVWSVVDDNVILLRSPDIQHGFDPAVSGRSSGGPEEQRSQPAWWCTDH